MYIIVKQLHSATTLYDLEQFVNPALKGFLWQKGAALKALKIVGLVNKEGHVVERLGLIRVTPESEKTRLIRLLNGKSIGAIPCNLSEYTVRHWSNDRRDNAFVQNADNADLDNRRKTDRRRISLRTITLSEKTDY